MKIIFRCNNQSTKKSIEQSGVIEERLIELDKFVSENAIARLSLFVDSGLSFATLDINDGEKHVHATCRGKYFLEVLQSVIKKCTNQLKKLKYNFNNDTLRYNNEINMTFADIEENIELNPKILDNFKLIELEENLTREKETSRYEKIMNNYVDYLYREHDIERISDHLRVLYSIYDEIDKEEISAADYERLVQSINELNKELYLMLEMQESYEDNKKDKAYVNYIIEEELKLIKLKK